MAKDFVKRIEAVVGQMKLDMRKKWWYWLIVPVLTIPYWVFQGWVVDETKHLYTAYVTWNFVKSSFVFPSAAKNPFVVMVGSFLLVICGFFVHAYFETRRKASIVGAADLLLVRLDLNDLHIAPDWSFAADFGVFVHMSVSVTDKPRTMKGFIAEIRTLKDGVVQNPPAYVAKSEHAVGEYLHRYKRDAVNSYGYAIVEEFRDAMDDLTSKVRSELKPDQHAEGWVRFELKGVKHDLKGCNIVIYAVDATDGKHEIATTDMKVLGVEDQEYAVPRQR